MRAMSVLENAKSNRHRKTHLVEPDGAGRELMHLTRGGLRRESAGEVSRGRSSEEVLETEWSEGLKNQKTDRFEQLQETASSIPKQANVATAAAIRLAIRSG